LLSVVGVLAGLSAVCVTAACGDESLVTLLPKAELVFGEQVSPPVPALALGVGVPRGGSRDVTVMLRNRGSGDLVVQAIDIGVDVDACPHAPAETIVVASPTSVPPGFSAPITFSLSPSEDAGCVALHVATNDPETTTLTAVVDFHVDDNVCSFTVDDAVDFGDVPVGLSRLGSVQFRSTGTASCVFLSSVVEGSSAFVAVGGEAGAVPPGAVGRIDVLFTPTAQGQQTGTLQLQAGDAITSVSLRGAGRSPDATGEENDPPPDGSATGCTGVTWVVLEARDGLSLVGSDDTTNAYNGDTSCDVELPVLCLRRSGLPAPDGIAFDFYNGWTGGDVALTAPVAGHTLTSRAAADALCAATFGDGFAMGEHHDGGGGWHWWARGTIAPTGRFWATVDDQPSSPWSSR
jgi:hypothetical protein